MVKRLPLPSALSPTGWSPPTLEFLNPLGAHTAAGLPKSRAKGSSATDGSHLCAGHSPAPLRPCAPGLKVPVLMGGAQTDGRFLGTEVRAAKAAASFTSWASPQPTPQAQTTKALQGARRGGPLPLPHGTPGHSSTGLTPELQQSMKTLRGPQLLTTAARSPGLGQASPPASAHIFCFDGAKARRNQESFLREAHVGR